MKKCVFSMITVLVIILLLSVLIDVQAFSISNPDAYINQHAGENGKIIPIGNTIVGIIKAFGIALSVLILTIIGIKYIFGSVEEKAQYKQTLWPYIIGALLIFAGAEITNIIYNAVH